MTTLKSRPWTLSRLLRLLCPACGEDTFRAGWFRTARTCRSCGLVFEREQGFYAGAIYPFYAASAAVGGGAMLAGSALGLGFGPALVAAAAAVVLASPWLFWFARLAYRNTDHRFFGEPS